MVRVNVNHEILQWVAERSGKLGKIQEKFPNWQKWLTNEIQPTFNQLEKLAKMTSTPFGYFFLNQPPIERLPIPHFRTVNTENQRSSPSPDLLETVQIMERRVEWMHEYLSNQGFEPLPFVGINNFTDDPVEIANRIRDTLGLKGGWAASVHTWQDALRMLFQKIDDARILLVVNGVVGNNTHRKLDVQEFRGFVLADDYAPLIFVNGADGKAAQMFTVAHELAHIWLGFSAAFDLSELHPANNNIEIACDKVAAEFLVPESELQAKWHDVRTSANRYQQLARHFKVSEIVAARRLLDLRLININEFYEFYNNRITGDSGTDSSGGNFYATQTFRIGRRFAETIIRATMEGKILYNEAYRLTGLKGNTFSEFASRLGFGGDV